MSISEVIKTHFLEWHDASPVGQISHTEQHVHPSFEPPHNGSKHSQWLLKKMSEGWYGLYFPELSPLISDGILFTLDIIVYLVLSFTSLQTIIMDIANFTYLMIC